MNTSSLIKTIFHNSIADGIYDEIVNRTSRYYYFLGKTLSWDDDNNPPFPIDSFDYELTTRNEIITLKEIKPTDVSYVVTRLDWETGVVFDMYDDQYSKEVQGINLISGGIGYNTVPKVYIGSGGSTNWVGSAEVSYGDFLKVTSGSSTRYYIVLNQGVTGVAAPTHTDGTYNNGTASLMAVIVSDGGGSGASATAEVLDGKVIGINLDKKGINYVSNPTVIIATTANTGNAAYAEAVVNVAPSGAQSIQSAKFYVLTDDYNVYVCLDNNYGAASTYKPNGTSVDPVVYPDGYMWKFVYTVPVALRNKFVTDQYIPVVTALRNQFYSNGSIKTVRINNAGQDYTNGSISVQGDGHLESDPVYLYDYNLNDGGTDYTSDAYLVVASPFTNTSDWSASTLFLIGQRLKYGRHVYEVSVSGTTGLTGPVHTSGIVANGTAGLKYIGSLVVGDITVQGGVVTDVLFYASVRSVDPSSYGSGYTSVPEVVISAPFFTSNSAVNTTTEVITLSSMHCLQTGDSVVYTAGATAIGGLVTGQTYYVIRTGVKTIKLATSYSNAQDGVAINLSSTGSGTQTFTYNAGTAKAYAVMQGGHLSKFIITDSGYGYTTNPTVTIGNHWTASTAYTLGQQISYQNRLYTVSVAGTTSSSAPIHTSGSAANGTATLDYVGVPIAATAQLKYGEGYSSTPTVSVNAVGGSDASINFFAVKSEAKLVPFFEGGQIRSVLIDDGGIGYTTANLTVEGDGTGAELAADLSVGDINTLQANTELLTVDGKINTIKVMSRGYGYSTASLVIDGDGTGAAGTVVVENGFVKKIVMTNFGSGYKWATATIVGNGYGAKARVVIGPYGGHGKNMLNQLYSRTLMFYSNVSSDKNQGFTVNNDYRQVGIIKNPTQFESTKVLTSPIGSSCWIISGDANISDAIPDSIITESNYGRKFRVVSNSGSSILVQSLDNYTPIIGTVFLTASNTLFNCSAVTPPNTDKYSGDLMFIDNKYAFFPTEDQFVSLRTTIVF